jgi:chromosome segregation ATPase
MATNDHVTKADLTAGLKDLRDELKADISGLRNELKADMSALRDELSEAIHDTETKLLKAFYGFAESNEKRHVESERATNGLRERLATIEHRLTEVEKRLNFPQAS